MSPPLVPPGYLQEVSIGVAVGGGLVMWLALESMPSGFLFDADADEQEGAKLLLAVLMAAWAGSSVRMFPPFATVYVVLGGVVFLAGMAFVLLITTDLLLMS